MTFPAPTIDKLGKLFPRLASDHDGEVIATVRAIMRTLGSAGLSLHDLSGAMQSKTVERIVYREKTVYRNRPEPKPSSESEEAHPEWIDIPDKANIVRLADIFLNECDLSDREEKFIRHMRQMASRRPKMRMSGKQKARWDILLDQHSVEEEEAA